MCGIINNDGTELYTKGAVEFLQIHHLKRGMGHVKGHSKGLGLGQEQDKAV